MPARPTEITGYAFAGDDRQISRVDISLDGETTGSAHLDGQASPCAWRHWHTTLDLPVGQAEVTARAWDTAAAAQPELAKHLWNPKGYVNNSWPTSN